MDYSTLSNYEVNKAVAESLGAVVSETRHHPELDCVSIGSIPHLTRDYCNNPAEIWPFILKHGISLDSPLPNINKLWMARYDGWGMRFEDENPLRAACIVYLMMNEQ